MITRILLVFFLLSLGALFLIFGSRPTQCPAYALVQTVSTTLHYLGEAIDEHKRQVGHYPVSLDELTPPPRSDSWGHPYVFQPSEHGYQLYSVGQNGVDQQGAGDDIRVGVKPDPEFYPRPKMRWPDLALNLLILSNFLSLIALLIIFCARGIQAFSVR